MEFENMGKGTKAFIKALEDASDMSKHDDENPMNDAEKACTFGMMLVIRDCIIPTSENQQEVDDRVTKLLDKIYEKGEDFEKPICLAVQRIYIMSRLADLFDEKERS